MTYHDIPFKTHEIPEKNPHGNPQIGEIGDPSSYLPPRAAGKLPAGPGGVTDTMRSIKKTVIVHRKP